MSVIATATNSVTFISWVNEILQKQATIDYYSVIESIATAIATPSVSTTETYIDKSASFKFYKSLI